MLSSFMKDKDTVQYIENSVFFWNFPGNFQYKGKKPTIPSFILITICFMLLKYFLLWRKYQFFIGYRNNFHHHLFFEKKNRGLFLPKNHNLLIFQAR